MTRVLCRRLEEQVRRGNAAQWMWACGRRGVVLACARLLHVFRALWGIDRKGCGGSGSVAAGG